MGKPRGICAGETGEGGLKTKGVKKPSARSQLNSSGGVSRGNNKTGGKPRTGTLERAADLHIIGRLSKSQRTVTARPIKRRAWGATWSVSSENETRVKKEGSDRIAQQHALGIELDIDDTKHFPVTLKSA